MTQKLGYDAPKLTRDEATELCVYHLRCAAGLFQLVPDDDNVALVAEIKRQCDDVEAPAALTWASDMLSIYEEMKEQE